ncbi:MAG TPA: serine hydrolase [Burkholderiales bacterium]|jgi:CubicO group peptidase (beta-lactamase class C family)|nr:serine hydrolase [Burkholderiales bacterium]
MRRRTFLTGLAAAPTLPILGRSARAQGNLVGQIAAFVQAALDHWQVPGAAVAVIHEGKRLLVEGYGVKNSVSGGKVDSHTAFHIGSCSKAYTACAAAIAIEDGRIGWDVPVRKFLPELELYDPQITAAVTLRDLLSHRVGLSRAWVGEYGSDLTRKQMLLRAAQAGRRAGFRERMCYSNLGFVVAAETVGRAAGVPFEDFLDSRVLRPLGMADSTGQARSWLARSNIAAPHRVTDDRVQTVPPMDHDNLMGAGSLCVSAHDAATWLECQLGTRSLVSPANLREMHSPQIMEPERHGLGWTIGTFRGEPFVGHTGHTRGFNCRTRVDPAAGYAAFAAVNAEGSAAEAIVAYIGQVLDRNPARDWIAFFDGFRARWIAETNGKMDEDRAADALTGASVPALDTFAGAYRDGGMGTLTLRERDGALRIAIQDLSLYDGWLVRYGGMHFAHQMDGFRANKDRRPVSASTRFRFHAHEGRIVAAEWLDAWMGPVRFERVSQ